MSDNIATYVNIAGPTLGMPKSVSALLSGEMRDTAVLNELEMTLGPMINTFVEKTDRIFGGNHVSLSELVEFVVDVAHRRG